MAFKLGLGLVALSSVAAAQPAPPPKVPTLSREFVDHLRAPDAGDRRSMTLLVQELKRLERLLQVTPKKSADRPLLLRRLAEGYAELAALAAREKAVADERLRRANRAQPPSR
jgi:hypothetical protein